MAKRTAKWQAGAEAVGNGDRQCERAHVRVPVKPESVMVVSKGQATSVPRTVTYRSPAAEQRMG
jgi:hypothetical protein